MKLERKIYETKQEKRKDFIIGIGIWLVLNVLLYSGVVAFQVFVVRGDPEMNRIYSILSPVLSFLPFLVNIAIAVYFAFTRQWIALGMLVAYASLIVLAVVAGIIASIVCFIGFIGSGGL